MLYFHGSEFARVIWHIFAFQSRPEPIWECSVRAMSLRVSSFDEVSDHYRSEGFKPVFFAIFANMAGPISSES